MKKLTGNQSKLDLNKNGKLDSNDFKMLRGEMANGGGTKNGGFKEITTNELDKVRDKVNSFLNPFGYSAKVEKSIGDVLYIIEPSTKKVGNKRSDFFDGMQILAMDNGTFEVSEYMAGENENELYIYKETNSLTNALKDLIKGNKRKPIKKYANGGSLADTPESFPSTDAMSYGDGGSTSGWCYSIGGL